MQIAEARALMRLGEADLGYAAHVSILALAGGGRAPGGLPAAGVTEGAGA